MSKFEIIYNDFQDASKYWRESFASAAQEMMRTHPLQQTTSVRLSGVYKIHPIDRKNVNQGISEALKIEDIDQRIAALKAVFSKQSNLDVLRGVLFDILMPTQAHAYQSPGKEKVVSDLIDAFGDVNFVIDKFLVNLDPGDDPIKALAIRVNGFAKRAIEFGLIRQLEIHDKQDTSIDFQTGEDGQTVGEGLSGEDLNYDEGSQEDTYEDPAKVFDRQEMIEPELMKYIGYLKEAMNRGVDATTLGGIIDIVDGLLKEYVSTTSKNADISDIVTTVNQATEKLEQMINGGAYSDAMSPEKLTGLMHKLMETKSDMGESLLSIIGRRSKRDRVLSNPADFASTYEQRRNQSRDLLPYLARLVSPFGSIPELNMGSLKELFRVYHSNPDSPEGRRALFILKKFSDSLEFRQMNENFTLPIDPRTNRIDSGQYADYEQGQQPQEELPEELPEDGEEGTDVIDVSGKPTRLRHWTSRLDVPAARHVFKQSVNDELDQNPDFDDESRQHSRSLLDQIDPPTYRLRGQQMAIGMPLAAAEQLRETEFSGKPWRQMSDEDIAAIVDSVITKYFYAQNRHIRGIGENKQKSPDQLLKQRKIQEQYLMDVLRNVRTWDSGGSLERKTVFPDINKYFEEQGRRSAVASKLLRIANVLDENNYTQEAMMIDEFVKDYVG